MSYISFYRKWRPQAFSEVVGQEHIVKTLQNAISKNRLVHGYMFCGPKGTGKTSIARIFAKAINCVNGPAVEPCNKCDNCISITAGSNVDIVEIDGASNNGIENIRNLREKIKFLPVFLRKKIYIIDEAHQITAAAFNALLKTLEEPPEHVIFVMATTDPNKVIKTIMSRCQRFDFEPISLDGLRLRLKDIASSENIDITDSALSIVAKYSDGSLRDAEGILEQLSSFNDGRITVDDVSSILGIIDQDMLFELANIILEKNINQGLLFVSRLFSTSFSLNAFISEFLEHFYSLYVIKNSENPADILDMPDDFKENYYNQAGLFTSRHIESLISLFSGLLAQIKESENPKTFFKAAVIKALNTNTEEIKGGQALRKDQPISSDQMIKSDEPINSLKTMGQDARQSGKEPVELNTLDKSAAEAVVIQTSSVKALDISGNAVLTKMPLQKKTAKDENELGVEMAGAFPDKKDSKQSVEKATFKTAAETAPDKADAKQSVKKAPDKVAIKESIREAPDKDVAKTTAGSIVLEGMGGEFLETTVQNSNKTTDDFSRIIPEIWETVLVKIKIKSVPLQAVLKEVKRFDISQDKIILYLEPKNHWHKGELGKSENKALIQELLESLTGEKFVISFDFISDKNINESIDLEQQARKISSAGNLPSDHKETQGLGAGLLDVNSPQIDAHNIKPALSKGPNGEQVIEGSDAYGYFEEKFKVKEK